MDENEDRGQNFTLLLLLFISFILVLVDSLEIYHVVLNWEYGMMITTPIFESCIKWELFAKTIFALFSLFGALSAFTLTVFLLIDTNWFADKILSTFLYFNYLIFGPYMLGFSVLGMINWTKVIYICDKQNLNNKIFSPANMFSLLGCFFIALIITFLEAVCSTVNLYFNSILRKPEGSYIIRKLFWWSIFRNSDPIEIVRRAQSQQVQEANNNNNNEV